MKEEIIYYEGTETGKIAKRICEYSIPEKIQDQVGPKFENLTQWKMYLPTAEALKLDDL